MRPGCTYAAFVTGANLIWFLIITTMAVVKLVKYGAYEYIIHFTNWAWTLACIFFGGTLSFSLSAHSREARARPDFKPATDAPTTCYNVRCAALWVSLFFFPLFGLVFFIALAVFVMLLMNPAFLTGLFMMLGPGVVMVANDIFHVVPVIALVLYGAINAPLIWYALNRTYVWARRIGRACVGVCCVCLACGANTLLLLVYLLVLVIANTSVEDVYGAGANPWLGLLGIVLAGALTSGVVLVLVNAYTNLGYDDDAEMVMLFEARAMLKTDEDIFDNRDGLLVLRADIAKQLSAATTAAKRDVEDVPPLRRRRKTEYGWP